MASTMRFSLLLGFLMACSSDPDAVTAQYDFQATVRTGTSAGLTLQGDMVLMPTSTASTAVGVLHIPAAGTQVEQAIPVWAQTTGQNISMTFIQSNGQTIVGTGPFSGTYDASPVSIQGTLTGPTANDMGDWAGQLKPCTPSQRHICTTGVLRCAQYGTCNSDTDFGNICGRSCPACKCIREVLVLPDCRCAL